MVVIAATSVAYLGAGNARDVRHRSEPHVCPMVLSCVLQGRDLNFRTSSKTTGYPHY